MLRNLEGLYRQTDTFVTFSLVDASSRLNRKRLENVLYILARTLKVAQDNSDSWDTYTV